MRGVNARAHVAVMQYEPVVVYPPVLDEVADAVRLVPLALDAGDAVAVLADVPRPEPASLRPARTIDVRPESVDLNKVKFWDALRHEISSRGGEKIKCPLEDSNLRLLPCEGSTLPLS